MILTSETKFTCLILIQYNTVQTNILYSCMLYYLDSLELDYTHIPSGWSILFLLRITASSVFFFRFCLAYFVHLLESRVHKTVSLQEDSFQATYEKFHDLSLYIAIIDHLKTNNKKHHVSLPPAP